MLSNLNRMMLTLALLTMSAVTAAKSITVEHPLGKTTLETSPERVIVLGMDTLDVLDSLSIEPIGVVKAPMPQYLNKYQDDKYVSVGSLFEPDFETIYSLKPDLIIASNRSSTSYEELSKIAPTVVFMADAKNYWETTQTAWRMIGEIFEKQDHIEKVINHQQKQIDAIAALTEENEPQVMMVMTNGGKVATFGENSRYSAIYNLFGFKAAKSNQENKNHGDLISFEYIAEVNPEHILILDRDQAIGRPSGEAFEKLDNPIIATTKAAKAGSIHYLNPTAWYISASGIKATQFIIDDLKGVTQ